MKVPQCADPCPLILAGPQVLMEKEAANLQMRAELSTAQEASSL